MEKSGKFFWAQVENLSVTGAKQELVERAVVFHLGQVLREFTNGTLSEDRGLNVEEGTFCRQPQLIESNLARWWEWNCFWCCEPWPRNYIYGHAMWLPQCSMGSPMYGISEQNQLVFYKWCYGRSFWGLLSFGTWNVDEQTCVYEMVTRKACSRPSFWWKEACECYWQLEWEWYYVRC